MITAEIEQRRANLNAALTKKQGAQLARLFGWRGDEARATKAELVHYLSAQPDAEVDAAAESLGATVASVVRERAPEITQAPTQATAEQAAPRMVLHRTIQTRYASACGACGQIIPKDSQALYYPQAERGKRIRHIDCAQAPTPAPEPKAPVTAEPKAPTTAAQQLADAVAAVLAGMTPQLDEERVRQIAAEVAGPVDMERVQAMVEQAAAALRPVEIHLPSGATTTLPSVPEGEHYHPMFTKVVALLSAGINVLLVGPAGTGKTYLAEQAARVLNAAFSTIHCTAGLSESALSGWLLPVGEGGRFLFVPAEFAKLYEAGNAVLCIDEMDNADANTLGFLNGALANGHLHIPQSFDKPVWDRGENVRIIACANTYGQGADLQYVGRNQLDAATLDRFYVVHIGYDEARERAFCGLPVIPAAKWEQAPEATAQELADLGQWVLDLRAKVAKHGLRRVVGRAVTRAIIARRDARVPAEEIKSDILAGWTRDEIKKVEG